MLKKSGNSIRIELYLTKRKLPTMEAKPVPNLTVGFSELIDCLRVVEARHPGCGEWSAPEPLRFRAVTQEKHQASGICITGLHTNNSPKSPKFLLTVRDENLLAHTPVVYRL